MATSIESRSLPSSSPKSRQSSTTSIGSMSPSSRHSRGPSSISARSQGGGESVRSDSVVDLSDPNLWKTHSVKQIVEIEKNTRVRAQEKQEELRQLVGESYRDLLATADSITQMDEGMVTVLGTLTSLKKTYDSIPSIQIQATVDSEAVKQAQKEAQFRRLIRIVCETPERIWSDIDSHQFTAASNRYFEARKISSQIQNKQHPLYAKLRKDGLLVFLSQHWATVCSMPRQIVSASHKRLRTQGLNYSEYVDALCSIGMLEHFSTDVSCSVEQLLDIFLESRTHRIDVLIKAMTQVLESRTDDPTRVLSHGFSNIAESLTGAILQVAEMFHNEGKSRNGSLLHAQLLENCNLSTIDISPARLSSRCSDWLLQRQRDIEPHLLNLLARLSIGSQIAQVRDAVLESICIDNQQPLDSRKWTRACSTINIDIDLTSKFIDLWEFFFHKTFDEQFRKIIHLTFDSFLKEALKILTLRQKNLKTDQSPDNLDEKVSEIEEKADEKSESVDVNVLDDDVARHFCEGFQELLGDAVTDMECLFNWQNPILCSSFLKEYSETKLDMLAKTTCVDTFKTLSQKLESKLSQFDEKINQTDEKNEENGTDDQTQQIQEYVDDSVLLARICSELVHFCKPLERFLSNSEYSKIQKMLEGCADYGYSIWSQYICSKLGNAYLLDLQRWMEQWKHSDSENSIWKDEESEGLLVPTHASRHVVKFLFELTHQIQKVIHGNEHHDHDKTVILTISSIIRTLLKLHDDILREEFSTLSEPSRLQMLFDLTFVFEVLALPTQQTGSDTDRSLRRSQSAILKKISRDIDPIDWIYYDKYLKQNAAILHQRCDVVFGSIVQLSKRHRVNVDRSPPRLKNTGRANILPVARPIKRIQALPVGAYPPANTKATVLQTSPTGVYPHVIKSFDDLKYTPSITVDKVVGSSLDKLESISDTFLDNVESLTGGWVGSVFGKSQKQVK